MDHAVGMGVTQACRNTLDDAPRELWSQRAVAAAPEQRVQRFAVEPFHYQVEQLAVLIEVVDADDVRM